MGRICQEVQAHLPGLVDGTLGAGRRRLVSVHLRRCPVCREEHDRQHAVAAGLDRLGTAAAEDPVMPPDELLDELLAQARRPGVRGRAAVPARGAVSGARPALSVALLAAGAVAGTAAGYAGWRGMRTVSGAMGHRRRGTRGAGRGRGRGSGRRGAGR